MQAFEFNALIVALLCVLSCVSKSVHCMEGRDNQLENIDSEPIKLGPKELVKEFLQKKHYIPVDSLKNIIKKYNFPPVSFPLELMEIFTETEKLAENAINSGLTAKDMPDLLKECVNQQLDPYVVFCLLKALNDRFYEKDVNKKSALSAFKLMSRSVLNAPFTYRIHNNQKVSQGSFAYFAVMAKHQRDLDCHNDGSQKELRDYWQIYFHEHCYHFHIVPWVSALYFFYKREGRFLESLVDPFGSSGFIEILERKISRPGIFYQEGAVEEMSFVFKNQYNLSTEHELDFFKWLADEYVMVDVDIYWHLLPKLMNKDEKLQEQFWTIMIKAGADPFTLVDRKGTTPIEMAKKFNLLAIEKKILAMNKPLLSEERPVKSLLENTKSGYPDDKAKRNRILSFGEKDSKEMKDKKLRKIICSDPNFVQKNEEESTLLERLRCEEKFLDKN